MYSNSNQDKKNSVLRKSIYSITSNIFSSTVSGIIILIMPKLMGIEQYGYWQLYAFYISLVGFFHFGWLNGMYLKYGGMKYSKLDKPLFVTQFWLLTLLEVVISFIVAIITSRLLLGQDKEFVVYMTCISGVIIILQTYISIILQLTNRIELYAGLLLEERIIYVILFVVILVLKINSYKILIIVDIVSKAIALLTGGVICRSVIIGRMISFRIAIKEAWSNISIGVKLMLANIADMLIIGIVRFMVENKFGIIMFSKVSLALTISNIMLFLVNSIGVAVFPFLRITDKERLPKIYMRVRDKLMFILFAVLIFFFPIKEIMVRWLPMYKESFMYMGIIFPMCIFECRFAMLIITYLNNFRKEKVVLVTNGIAVLISTALSFIFVYIYPNINLVMLSMVFALSIKCILAELYLTKYMKLNVNRKIILEVILVVIFIIVVQTLNSFVACVVYVISYLGYLIVGRKKGKN